MQRSYRIRIKSVKQYVKTVAVLKEYGYSFPSYDADELSFRRHRRKAWLYLGSGGIGWLFFSKTPVQYSRELTLKELKHEWKRYTHK